MSTYPKLNAGITGYVTVNTPKAYTRNTSYKVLTTIQVDGGNSWTIKVYAIQYNSGSNFQVGWASKSDTLSNTGQFAWYSYGF